MKKTLFILMLPITGITFGQNADDAPIQSLNNNGFHGHTSGITYNDESKALVFTGTTIASCDSGSTTISVTGACSYTWYADSALTMPLPTAPNGDFTTPVLYNDMTYYCEALEPSTSTLMTITPQTGPYTGNVRGYWFTAQSDFMITGVTIPTDASTGLISAAVMRFDSIPPDYAAFTNNFQTLGYWPQAIDDTIYTCIPVYTGDIIGVLGFRGNINSYGASPSNATIAGQTTQVARLLMQYDLATTAPQELSTTAAGSGSISRVELITADTWNTTVEAVTVDIYALDTSVTPGFGDFTANETGVSYQWIDCNAGTPLAGETGQVFAPTANGLYAVEVSDANCTDTSSCYLVDYIGLDELTNGSIDVYPNPATESIKISVGTPMNNAMLYIFDAQGKVVKRVNSINGMSFDLNTEKLESGRYTLKLANHGDIYTQPLIKY